MYKNNWQQLEKVFNSELHEALLQQHHAAQFVAMVGRHLLPQESDDSNTNMEYLSGSGLLAGNMLPNGQRIALNPIQLRLYFLDNEGECGNEMNLEGKSKEEVFEELKTTLASLEFDVLEFKNELHYKLPDHFLDKGSSFIVDDPELFKENTKFRHNAEIVLNEIVATFDGGGTVKIWPHHFDTGALFIISEDENGDASQSIGIGFAIPDSMVDEPYYYLSFWSEKPVEGLNKLPSLDAGEWMVPDWSGAILKHSDIVKTGADEQYEYVKSFYISGINILLDRL